MDWLRADSVIKQITQVSHSYRLHCLCWRRTLPVTESCQQTTAILGWRTSTDCDKQRCCSLGFPEMNRLGLEGTQQKPKLRMPPFLVCMIFKYRLTRSGQQSGHHFNAAASAKQPRICGNEPQHKEFSNTSSWLSERTLRAGVCHQIQWSHYMTLC